MTSNPPPGTGDDQGWGPPGSADPTGRYPQQPGQQPGAQQQPGQQQGGQQQGGYPPPGGYPPGPPPGGPGQPYYGQPYPGGRGGPGAPPPQPNFFNALFDLNFTRFATPDVIKILYILIIVVVGLVWLSYVALGFSVSAVLGVGALIGGAVVAALTITFYRVVLEFFYAVIRMSEDIHNRR